MRLPIVKSLESLSDLVVLTAEPQVDGYCKTAAVHSPEVCVPPCAFHAPTRHALVHAPIALRMTVFGWQPFRACEHGNKHMDPDTVAKLRARGFQMGAASCSCGCCEEA